MKSLKLLSVFLFSISALQAQQVKFSDLKPEAGKTVSFTYDPKGTALENSQSIKCDVFLFDSKSAGVIVSPRSLIISLLKDGSIYKATVPTNDSTSLIALYFYSGSKSDNNPDGYYTPLYHHGKLNAVTYANEAYLLTSFVQYTFGTKPDLQKAQVAYEQAFILDPSLEDKLLFDYLVIRYRLDKTVGSKLMMEYIGQISGSRSVNKLALTKPITSDNPTNDKDASLVIPKKMSENDLSNTIKLYRILGEIDSADAAKNRLLKYYPTGSTALRMAADSLHLENNATVFEEKLNAIIAKYKLDVNNDKDAFHIFFTYLWLADLYAKEGNKEKFDFYANRIKNRVTRASIYNSSAILFAQKNEDVAYAAELSKKSIDLIADVKSDPLPNYTTPDKYAEKLDNDAGTYADTYASLLYKLGKYKDAVAYEEQAFAFTKDDDINMHIRYQTYLEKNGQFEKALTEDEIIIKNGSGTDSIRNDLKGLYTRLDKKGDYKVYLSKLESEGAVHERENWRSKMINIPAPAFSLMNLKGQKISLSDYKGKIVILDYWAIWCGPCKSTFPGMQKAINKYKDNPNVVFLFINTLQRDDFRVKTVKDYMNSTKYTFNVLLDVQSKKQGGQFEVVGQYKVTALPTKIIIDGKGNIRFKMTGASDNDDEIVKELDTMISLASS
ncbi:TlpA disulfide reductase family protein [Pedobacter sp. L105]|uniref:TlpA family protein disulfide reductase n=1 Tax=Pedobacter sp. L105 TaxID=1641871 RepID=UPI00131C8153|nr:TlpA disulfide reductase family protein [Pedobacter sp. L105]